MQRREVEQAFEQFIEFGQIFDSVTRRYIVQVLYEKFTGEPPELNIHAGKYLSYLRESLDRLFENQKILRIAAQNEAMMLQLTDDILKWLRKIDRKIEESNPYYPEKITFEAWTHKPTFLWRDTWFNCLNFLASEYEREELDTDFYKTKFKLLADTAPRNPAEQRDWDALPKKPELELVIDDLLAQWDALLSARILAHQIEELKKETDQLKSLVDAKIDEYEKIVNLVQPFAGEAGRFWDMSRNVWKDLVFNVLDQYETLLRDEKSVQQLADLLGRMREAEIETEEEIYEQVIIKKEWIPDHTLRQEFNGLAGSNDLNITLPAEMALLGDAAAETLFYQRFAESQLLSYRYEGKRLQTSDRVSFFSEQKQKRKEKGPFILCIDTSGSMFGLPSQIAKVIAFAVMKMAAREKRKCYLINFSIGIKTINLTDISASIDKIVEFLSMSFDGGTDVTPALSQALDMLQTNDYKDADLLMVSDFIMFEIREEILTKIRREQHRGTRFYSLTISNRANIEVLEAFDHCWTYDPEDRKIMRYLLDDLRKIRQEDI